MNRLILLGNGFDLAHRMKTSYKDFIDWYINNSFLAASEKRLYQDDLWKIQVSSSQYVKADHPNFNNIVKNAINVVCQDKARTTFFVSGDYERSTEPPISVKLIGESNFFRILLQKCNDFNWVDIENEYFIELKRIHNENSKNTVAALQNLNKTFKLIIKKLEEYLTTIQTNSFNDEYNDIFRSPILKSEIYSTKNDLIDLPIESHVPNSTMVLNFNYTNTIENYIDYFPDEFSEKFSHNVNINYIHGQLNNIDNPIIFGFGDELDSLYKDLESKNINDYFKFIKSFWYFKTQNYRNLTRFIESDNYQVLILGHSCGLSDRTMLNMIFENTSCKSIKIYAHKKDNGSTNYETMTHEISRHFGDKRMFRNLMVSENPKNTMPQLHN
jgi:hypothetical protein